MHPYKSFVFILILFGLATASFDVKQYLTSSENGTVISYDNFTLNGIQYNLVSIGGQNTFLLKNGVPLDNSSDIAAVIYSYYKNLYYPSSAELASIKTMVLQFNDSRNDGCKGFSDGLEEATCRKALFTDGRVQIYGKPVQCVDDESCNLNAALVFQAYREGLGLGSITTVLSPLKNFSYASNALEKAMVSNFNYLDTINESNAYTNLLAIKNSLSGIKTNVYDLEHTVFRTPRPDDKEDTYVCYTSTCYGLCPPITLNKTVLAALETNLTTITSRLSSFANYKNLSVSLASNTAYRYSHFANETNASYYSAIFAPLSVNGSMVIAFASGVESNIKNTSFSSDLASLKTLHSKINSSISSRDFKTMKSDLLKYGYLVSMVNQTANDLSLIYNRTITLQTKVDAMIFLLDSKDLDSTSRKDLDYLKNKTLYLSSVLKSGLTDTEVLDHEGNYSEMYNQTSILLKRYNTQPVSMAYIGFRGFARGVNTGIADMVSSSNVMPVSEVPEKSALTFGVFSLLTFVSLSSLAFIFFLILLNRVKHRPAKYGLAGGFLISLLVLTVFSVGLFFLLEKTSTNADVEEFVFDINKRNSVAIAVFANNTLDNAPMLTCSDSLATVFNGKNKSTMKYTFYAGYCEIENTSVTWDNSSNQTSVTKSVSNSTVSNCENQLKNEGSAVQFDYSSTSSQPTFSVIYVNRANVAADSSYYKSCPLVGLFS